GSLLACRQRLLPLDPHGVLELQAAQFLAQDRAVAERPARPVQLDGRPAARQLDPYVVDAGLDPIEHVEQGAQPLAVGPLVARAGEGDADQLRRAGRGRARRLGLGPAVAVAVAVATVAVPAVAVARAGDAAARLGTDDDLLSHRSSVGADGVW